MLFCKPNTSIRLIEVFHMEIVPVFVTIDNFSIVVCCDSHLKFSFDFIKIQFS